MGILLAIVIALSSNGKIVDPTTGNLKSTVVVDPTTGNLKTTIVIDPTTGN